MVTRHNLALVPEDGNDSLEPLYLGSMDTCEERLSINQLVIPVEYQTDFSGEWATRIAKNFREELLGKIRVNRRPDGITVVIDGQHRVDGVRKRFGYAKEIKVLCDVSNYATIREEAVEYDRLNRRRRTRTIRHTFPGLLVAEDNVALQLQATAAPFGYTFVGSKAINGQLPVGPFAQIRVGQERLDISTIEAVLAVLHEVYGERTAGLTSSLIIGLASFIATYKDALDFRKDRLVRVLRGVHASSMQQDITNLRNILHTSQRTAGRKAILAAYNHHLSIGRLTDV